MDYPDQRPLLQFIVALAECGAAAGALALLFLAFPRFLQKAFGELERAGCRFAERKTRSICSVFIGVVMLRLAALPLLKVPVPGIHDEYSYLLIADTMAHGRLANATHPMWISFETFHVNWSPTYASMYPPAQGFALALGQLLGHPWIGVLLSVAAMCSAILWMLQAWLPARWAFLGGVLVALKFGIASYWMNSYWGGAVAASGGALLLGALARIRRRASLRDALWMGLGIALLANSRPYEGFVFSLPAAGYLLWWLAGKTRAAVTRAARVRKVLIPVGAAVILTLGFMGYYNWRLTGNALLFPHILNARTYNTPPLFLWEEAKSAAHYRNAQFEDFYNGWERDSYQRGWADVWAVSLLKTTRFAIGYFWPGALLLVPGWFVALRDRRMRMLCVTLLFGLGGAYAVIWSNPHYAAPVTCVFFALAVQAMRHLRTMRLPGWRVGLLLSRAAVLLLVFDVGNSLIHRRCDTLRWPCEGDRNRAALLTRLQHTPGKHLVMVRYEDGHNVHDEWVFNGAEIDGAKVLWARELDAAQNEKLFRYFKDRQVWLVEPDDDAKELIPYEAPEP
jgi:hypothetical protein